MNALQLRKCDIVTAYWKRGNLHVATNKGGLVFGCQREQHDMVNALLGLGIKVAAPKLSREQKWMKDAHHVVNCLYFDGKLTTPYFEFKTLHIERDAQYETTTKTIAFDRHVWRNGFSKTPRSALDLMVHECCHQFLHENGWQPTKGINPHSEACFVLLCKILTVKLGLPYKSTFTLSELESFPASITHEDYYRIHAPRRPAYQWT